MHWLMTALWASFRRAECRGNISGAFNSLCLIESYQQFIKEINWILSQLSDIYFGCFTHIIEFLFEYKIIYFYKFLLHLIALWKKFMKRISAFPHTKWMQVFSTSLKKFVYVFVFVLYKCLPILFYWFIFQVFSRFYYVFA